MKAQSLSLSPCQCNALPLLNTPRLRPTALNPYYSHSKIYNSSLLLVSTKRTDQHSPPHAGANDSPKDTAGYFDENGAVEDMDGYLNYLSLEYDSVWDTKPSWCQPWTIVLAGVLVVAGSWLVLHSAIVTSLVLTLICAWWYIFLFSYPKAYSEMIADRRNRVRSGEEDIYGSGKT